MCLSRCWYEMSVGNRHTHTNTSHSTAQWCVVVISTRAIFSIFSICRCAFFPPLPRFSFIFPYTSRFACILYHSKTTQESNGTKKICGVLWCHLKHFFFRMLCVCAHFFLQRTATHKHMLAYIWHNNDHLFFSSSSSTRRRFFLNSRIHTLHTGSV